MQYITAQQTAEKWSVSLRYVRRLVSDGRIAGVQKYGRSWMIPADAEKPLDPRKLRKLPRDERAAFLFLTAADLPKNNPVAALSGLEETLRPLAAAIRSGDYALYLRNIGAYAEMPGVAKAALLLMEKPATFTWLDVYFYVLCAAAANALCDAEQAKRYLNAALALGMPAGFIAPFADSPGDFGGLVETAMERDYPQYRKDVIDLWKCSFKTICVSITPLQKAMSPRCSPRRNIKRRA